MGRRPVTDAAPARRVSWAERNQGISNEQDELLIQQARRNHPTCFWWWGRVVTNASAAAQCYICGARMVTFASKWPLTDTARKRIQKHRAEHIALLSSTLLNTKGTQ